MDRIKAHMELGAGLAESIRVALGRSVADFCREKEINSTVFSAVINGTRTANEKILSALIGEFGGSEDEWLRLLWQAREPESAEKSA